MRRVASIVVLVGLLVGPPVLLARLGFYAWLQLNVWAPADFRVLLGLLTVVGWCAWLVFAVSVVLEVLRVATSGRLAIQLPGLRLPQALAALLIATILSAGAAPALAAPEASPGPSAAASVPVVVDRTPSLVTASQTASNQTAGHTLTHVVAPGDELWSLAQRYYGSGTQWRQIVQANPALAADPTADLIEGSELVIAVPSGPTEAYVVRPGDTLWALAERTLGSGERYPELQRLNAGLVAAPDHIEVGWTLQLPVRVTPESAAVQSGEKVSRSDSGGDVEVAPLSLPDAAAPGSAPAAAPSVPSSAGLDLVPGPGAAGATSSAASTPAALPTPTAAAGGAPDAAAPTSAPATTHATDAASTSTAAPSPETAASSTSPSASASPTVAVPDAPAADPTGPSLLVDDSLGVRLALGGLAAVAASGVLLGARLLRRERESSRPVGRRFIEPSDEVRRLETALGLAGQLVPGDAQPPAGRPELVGAAMRLLADHWWAARLRPPRLRRAVLTEQVLVLQFTDPPPSLPPGFRTAPDNSCQITWSGLGAATPPDRSVVYPGLVTLGQDADGHLVMVDVVTWGVLAVDGEDAELPTQSLSAMTIELACAPWADELNLRVATADRRFVEVASVATPRTFAEPEAAVLELERQSRERRALLLLTSSSYDSLRLDPDLSDAWAPTVYLFERQPDAAQVHRIRAAVDGERLGLSAVVPVSAVAPAVAADEPRLHLVPGEPGEQPVAVLEPASVRVAAQTLRPEVRRAISDLYESARSDMTFPASWWREDLEAVEGLDDLEGVDMGEEPASTPLPVPRLESSARSGPSLRLIEADAAPPNAERPVPVDESTTVRPFRAVRAPRLRLFGAVGLDHAQGEEPAKSRRSCVEYCAWLLENPGATASEMNADLFVTDGTRRANLSRLRSWLGAGPDGELYLPEAYSGRIRLASTVSSDWIELKRLIDAGINQTPTDVLRSALALVGGAPMADASPGEWAWASALRSDMVELVRDLAVVLARRERIAGDLDAARWACQRGRLVAPDDELLVCELMRIADAAGQPDDVATLLRQLQRAASRRGVDLRGETVALAQELIEGRRREVLRIS